MNEKVRWHMLPCQKQRVECRSEVREAAGSGNPRIPAGWPLFGQFVAHYITHDRSPLQETEDVSTL